MKDLHVTLGASEFGLCYWNSWECASTIDSISGPMELHMEICPEHVYVTELDTLGT